MEREYDEYWDEPVGERPPDPAQERAYKHLLEVFRANRESVFFSRQLEVMHEHMFFHWVTNRALRQLVEEGEIVSETRKLKTGGELKLLWHRSYRYPRRAARDVERLVAEYSHPNIGGALGLHGEFMVMEGFARHQFVMRGRETREFGDRKWVGTEHNLDFIFERDGAAYGVEVKNTLGYMDYTELRIKVEICRYLGVRPVFVVRMVPKSWIYEVNKTEGSCWS